MLRSVTIHAFTLLLTRKQIGDIREVRHHPKSARTQGSRKLLELRGDEVGDAEHVCHACAPLPAKDCSVLTGTA